VYSNQKLIKELRYSISATPGYGVYLVIDEEKGAPVDRVEFVMADPMLAYEVYGTTVPAYPYPLVSRRSAAPGN
jgi:hypothetical protein